uniref:Lectin, mannose-binding, 1 n=1 Tax=Sphaeramia orbicularis TaxID=375764 RepID=A0A672YYN3_9TELE
MGDGLKKKKKKKNAPKNCPIRKRPVGLQASRHARGLCATSAVRSKHGGVRRAAPGCLRSSLHFNFCHNLRLSTQRRRRVRRWHGDGTSSSPPLRVQIQLQGPHLAQTDGGIPFWIHTGNAIPSADQVRITPSLRSQRGSVWTKNKVNFEHWEAEVTFRVSGRGRMGADGLAVWFTTAQGLDGPVYGAADHWNGVGVFFDSFDNDGKKNNPAILIVGNNGNLIMTIKSNFIDSFQSVILFHSHYVEAQLSLSLSLQDYEFCAKVDNIVIPREGFFGISAATGGLADDHDVLSFLVFSLTEPGQQPKRRTSTRRKFQNFQQELDKKKEEFQKEHPDVQGEPIEDLYESVNAREIRQVFEGQNRIHLEIKQLHRQLATMLAQDRNSFYDSLKQISSIQHQGNTAGMGTYETIQHFNDIKEHLHLVKRDMEHLVQKSNPAEKAVKCPELPPMPSCLSTVHFAVFIVVQSVLFFCYVMYKSQQEAAAKKFF